jgi:hypothetical protein
LDLDLHQQFGAHLVDGFIWPRDRKEEVYNLNKPSTFLNKGTFGTEEAVARSRLAAFDASSQFSHCQSRLKMKLTLSAPFLSHAGLGTEGSQLLKPFGLHQA